MKKLTLLLFCFFTLNSIFSQAPQSFNYQLIARDTSGKVLTNHLLGIQISILTDANNGKLAQMEELIGVIFKMVEQTRVIPALQTLLFIFIVYL